MLETGLGEDDAIKQLSTLQKAIGGLGTDENQTIAKQVIRHAQAQGTTADTLVSQVASLADMQGFEVGTDYFAARLANFSNMSFKEQQRYMRQAGLDYQKYAQWSTYLQGGNAEAYNLFTELGGTNTAQSQALQSVFSQAQMSGASLTPDLARSLATQANGLSPFRAIDVAQMSSGLLQTGVGTFADNFNALGKPGCFRRLWDQPPGEWFIRKRSDLGDRRKCHRRSDTDPQLFEGYHLRQCVCPGRLWPHG